MTPPKIKGGDRDAFVSKERLHTASPAPAVEIDEETSEAYEIGEPRNAFRAKRDTRERLAKMEEFKDHATAQFDKLNDAIGKVTDGQAAVVREVAGLAGQFKGVADVLTRQDALAVAERGAEIERTKIISEAAAKQSEIAAASATKQAELKSASSREIIKQVGPWIVAIGAVIGAVIHALVTAKP